MIDRHSVGFSPPPVVDIDFDLTAADREFLAEYQVPGVALLLSHSSADNVCRGSAPMTGRSLYESPGPVAGIVGAALQVNDMLVYRDGLGSRVPIADFMGVELTFNRAEAIDNQAISVHGSEHPRVGRH